MGSYKEIKGDLLDLFDAGEFDIIGHGCNCFGKMGAGIAKQIKERYPEAYYADLYSELPAIHRLGNFTSTYDDDIFNFYTQLDPGPNASLAAIELCLQKFDIYLPRHYFKIGLPLIGCGIGGLKWEDVKPIIQKKLKDRDVTVVFWDKE